MNENENTDNIGNFGEYNAVPVEPIVHPSLAKLYDEIADLKEKLVHSTTIASEAQTRLREQQSEYRENEGKLQDILIEALGDEEIDKDVADQIATLYDLDLRKVFNLTVKVELTIEVSAPVGTSVDDIADNVSLNWNAIDYSGVGELETSDWEIVDWTEN
jgi:hypothetical protein